MCSLPTCADGTVKPRRPRPHAMTPEERRPTSQPDPQPPDPQPPRPGPAKLPPIMEQSLLNAVHWLLALVALPEIGLPAIFLVSVVSATLLPLGSAPAVFGFVKIVRASCRERVCRDVWIQVVAVSLEKKTTYKDNT